MVLRFSCPCGAPYALADHLAGRTFTCTQCGVVLKIGSPVAAPPPPPPPSSDELISSMEWSSEQKRPALSSSGAALVPLDEDERRGASKRTKRPADDAPLALADEEPEDEDDDDEPHERPRRSGRSDLRTSGSSRMRTSGVTKGDAKLRTSGVTKGKSSSARSARASSGRQAAGRSDPGPALARSCPVCEAQIAAAAVVCPSCGVRLKERGTLERMVADGAWRGLVKGLAFLGLAGAIGFGAWTVMSKDQQRPPARLPTVAQDRPKDSTPSSTSSATERPTRPSTEGEAGAREDRRAGDDTKGSTGKDGEPASPAGPRPTGSPPRAPTSGDGPSRAARDEVTIVPPGPLEADFRRLRDASTADEVRAAIEALAAKPDLDEPLQQALKSLDRTYGLRLHRVRLAAGDEAKRRSTIEASLKGDDGLALVYTALAAVELDREGLRAQLQAIGYEPGRLAARAWADAALEATPPRDAALEALASAYDAADEESQRLLAPALALGGDGCGLTRCCEALAHDSEVVRAMARAGLEAISAGTGPGGDDPAAWRAWVDAYGPLRDVLARACGDPADLAEHVAARREALARVRELIPILPVFIKDSAARTPGGARTIGDLLALGATPADATAVNAVLAGLRGDMADHAVHVVWGAMVACDDAVADAAAQAIMRGAVKLEHAAALVPDLSRAAPGRTQEALGGWVRSLGPKAQPLGRLVAAAFRCGWLDAWMLEESHADRHGRVAVGARLASSRVEKALLDLVESGRPCAAFSSVPEALAGLGDFGTEAAAERLTKIAGDAPTPELLRALQRIGDERHARRLKRQVDTVTESAVAAGLFEAYARMLGPDAAAALAKRAREDDPMRLVARPVLLRLGGREARELARRPWEALSGKPDQRIPSFEEVQALVRAGAPEDAQLFKKVLIVFDKIGPNTRREILLGFGALGYQEGLSIIEGYIQDQHRERAVGAVSAAMLGATSTAARMKEVALSGRNPQAVNVENALIVASLARLSPDEGAQVARRYVDAALSRPNEEAVTAIAFALARGGDDEGLRPLCRASDVKVRAAAARGIALAAFSSRDGLARLPVLDDLRLDPAPEVRAEAAVARGVLCLDGAARDVLVALSSPDELLDVAGRGYGSSRGLVEGRSLLSYLAVTEDVTSLRHALWVAYDVATPGQGPTFRADLGRGRQRELLREARAKLR